MARPAALHAVACRQCRFSDRTSGCQQRHHTLLRKRLQAASTQRDGPAQSSRNPLPQAEQAEHTSSSTSVEPSSSAAAEAAEDDSPAVRAALAALDFYKTLISPLLPNTCRYLPTCSSYAKDAYRAYGVPKGTVLTAWRLMRCNPWGGRGYDPVQWPPPGLEGIFKDKQA